MGILHDELINDPNGIGYADPIAAGSHNVLADLLNTPRYGELGSVGITPMLEWIAAWGIMARLRAAVNGPDQSLASIAEVALMLVSNPNISSIDFSRPRVQQMLTVLATAGVFPQDAYDELEMLATTQVSRAKQLGLGTVTIDDISRALEE